MVGQFLGERHAPLAHAVHKVLAGVQHPGQLGDVEQAAVALQCMHAAEEIVDHVPVVGRLLQLHQLFADAFQ